MQKIKIIISLLFLCFAFPLTVHATDVEVQKVEQTGSSIVRLEDSVVFDLYRINNPQDDIYYMAYHADEFDRTYIGQIVTDSHGYGQIPNIDAGTYVLTETVHPKDENHKAKPLCFTLDGTLSKITIYPKDEPPKDEPLNPPLQKLPKTAIPKTDLAGAIIVVMGLAFLIRKSHNS